MQKKCRSQALVESVMEPTKYDCKMIINYINLAFGSYLNA